LGAVMIGRRDRLGDEEHADGHARRRVSPAGGLVTELLVQRAAASSADSARRAALWTAASTTDRWSTARVCLFRASLAEARVRALPETVPAMSCAGMRWTTYSTTAEYTTELPSVEASSERRLPVTITSGTFAFFATSLPRSSASSTTTPGSSASLARETAASSSDSFL